MYCRCFPLKIINRIQSGEKYFTTLLSGNENNELIFTLIEDMEG